MSRPFDYTRFKYWIQYIPASCIYKTVTLLYTLYSNNLKLMGVVTTMEKSRSLSLRGNRNAVKTGIDKKESIINIRCSRSIRDAAHKNAALEGKTLTQYITDLIEQQIIH